MGEQIKYFINNQQVEFLIDITKIYNTLPFINYKISCFANGKGCFAPKLKIKAKKQNEEYFFYAQFFVPIDAVNGKKFSFVLQQICTDEFNNQTAICHSYPVIISKIQI